MANTKSVDLELSSSQYLSITDANQTGLDITGDISLEAWVKLEQLPSTAGSVMALVVKDDVGTQRSYIFNVPTTDKLRFNYWSVSTNITTLDSTAAFFVAGDVGSWVHVAIAVDVSAQTAVMYKNGSSVAVTQTTTDATSIEDNASTFYIGGSTQFFDGLIDEVRVWSDIRTSTEISDNYEKELVGTEANLVGYWKLNNSLLDETSNDNDLTNNNSATFSTDVPFSGAVAGNSNFFMFM